jgi:hypothetical protein
LFILRINRESARVIFDLDPNIHPPWQTYTKKNKKNSLVSNKQVEIPYKMPGVDEKEKQPPIPNGAKTDAAPADALMSPNNSEDKDKDEDKEAKPDSETAAIKQVSFTELFRYASSYDKVLMTFGSIGAMGTGASQPVMTM